MFFFVRGVLVVEGGEQVGGGELVSLTVTVRESHLVRHWVSLLHESHVDSELK